jgi:hypothetical protein
MPSITVKDEGRTTTRVEIEFRVGRDRTYVEIDCFVSIR